MQTYFIDIDGTLLEHIEDFSKIYTTPPVALPGASEKTAELHCRGDMIILTTARPESLRDLTIYQLGSLGVFYDLLIMGIGAGNRIVVNDYAEGKPYKAWAYNVLRNKEGIKDVP
jgi:hypothetical protein